MGDRRAWGVLGVAMWSLFAVAGQAEAQEAAVRTHDGLYLQLTGGLGYASTSGITGQVFVDDVREKFDRSVSGLTLDTSIMVGAEATTGLTLGLGFVLGYLPSPAVTPSKLDVGDEGMPDVIALPNPKSHVFAALGVFADYYLDPAGGLHFQGFAGLGGLEPTSEPPTEITSDPTAVPTPGRPPEETESVGLVLSVAGGYDVWISDDLSVGAMLRFAVGAMSNNGIDGTTFAPTLLANITYN